MDEVSEGVVLAAGVRVEGTEKNVEENVREAERKETLSLTCLSIRLEACAYKCLH